MAGFRFAKREAREALRTEPQLMTVRHVGTLLGVHERTVRRWLASGALAGLVLGGKSYLVPKAALINFLCGEMPLESNEE